MTDNKLRFIEPEQHFDVSFWYELERLKLNVWRLDAPQLVVRGAVPSASSLRHVAGQLASRIALDSSAFTNEASAGAAATEASSRSDAVDIDLQNFNTDEELRKLDRGATLSAAARPVLDALARGDFTGVNALRGVLRTFADLKAHVFSSVSGFPVVEFPAKSSIEVVVPEAGAGAKALAKPLYDAYVAARSGGAAGAAVPMLADLENATVTAFTEAAVKGIAAGGGKPFVLMRDYAASDAGHPSWPWRSVISAVRLWAPSLQSMGLMCVRESADASETIHCRFDAASDADAQDARRAVQAAAGGDGAALAQSTSVRLVGWASKLRKIDLGSMMDPSRLAESSARLNLGLMKWRMMPDLDLDVVSRTKVLLLGSGTLGCNIARHLMMWGVNKITLVDRGFVSYSNPVRQTLFELSDCIAEGEARHKAFAAAAAIKRILPTCDAQGVSLTIRMPGHAVDAVHEAEARADVERLEELIKAHDVVFLLTDSRESRWLPTLLCSANDKPVINSALGFDTYVVMRHGLNRVPRDRRVGCYFCNDVVAPMDSLTARTLDQQCTVTRPGVSAMASALSVEVLAALCNHKDGFACPAYVPSEDETSEAKTVIGIVPHQIRGSVSDYTQMVLYGEAYDKCTACSDKVVGLYREQGWKFILQCLNNPKYMEEVTGLAAERVALAEKYANWDDDDFGEDE